MSNVTQFRVTGPEDRVLYDRDGIRVTGRWLVVGDRYYHISELRHLRTCRGPRSPHRVNTGIVAAVGLVLIVIALSARFLDTPGWIGAAVVLAVPLALAVIAAADGARAYELWSVTGGHSAIVLSEPFSERYHQIVRAIVRAQERMEAA